MRNEFSAIQKIDTQNKKFMDQCASIYERMVKDLHKNLRRNDPSRVAEQISLIILFAHKWHPGRFEDERLDSLLAKIGNGITAKPFSENELKVISNYSQNKKRKVKGKHILHLATEIYPIGGHTRLIKRWVEWDPNNTHSLLVTRQREEIPSWMLNAIRHSGGKVYKFNPHVSLMDKVAWLKKLINNKTYSFVIGHLHPYDVVAALAFSESNSPSFGIMNHADHVFWIGGSVAELVIDFNSKGMECSKKRRFLDKCELLPLPILEPETSQRERQQARRDLGISDDDVALISMGSSFKYYPSKKFDFFRMVLPILNRHKNVHLYIVGLDKPPLPGYMHERLHYIRATEDTKKYLLSGDIYLEGFPLGSTTSLLEAGSYKIPIVRMSHKVEGVYTTSDDSLEGWSAIANDEEEYANYVEKFIQCPELRMEKSKEIKERVMAIHSGQHWEKCLRSVYKSLETKQRMVQQNSKRRQAKIESHDMVLAECSKQPALKILLMRCIIRKYSKNFSLSVNIKLTSLLASYAKDNKRYETKLFFFKMLFFFLAYRVKYSVVDSINAAVNRAIKRKALSNVMTQENMLF